MATNMTDHRHEAPDAPGFWRSRAGIALMIALAVGALLLGYEHRLHLLASNWLYLLPLAACLGVHFFLHGGHGGGSHGSQADGDEK